MILPKSNEVDAVLKILDQDYEDSEAGDITLAKDIVRAVWEEISRRDSFIVLERGEGFDMFWPFLYEKDALRFHQQLYPLAPRRIGKMRSPVTTLETKAKYEQEAKERRP